MVSASQLIEDVAESQSRSLSSRTSAGAIGRPFSFRGAQLGDDDVECLASGGLEQGEGQESVDRLRVGDELGWHGGFFQCVGVTSGIIAERVQSGRDYERRPQGAVVAR